MKNLIIFVCLLSLAPNYLFAYPQRIISSTVASDEILLALLEGQKDEKRIIAVSEFALSSSYSHIKKLPQGLKHRITSNNEFLIKLKPDLVILTSFSNPNKKQILTKFNIPFYEMKNFDDIAGIKREILEIGRLVGKQKKASEIVNQMDVRLEKIGKMRPVPTVLNYSENSILLGDKTLFNDIIEKAGASNLAKKVGIVRWQKVSDEFLLGLNPDFIISDTAELNSVPTSWRSKKAMQSSNIIYIPSRDLLSTSQYIVEAVEKVHRQLRLKITSK